MRKLLFPLTLLVGAAIAAACAGDGAPLPSENSAASTLSANRQIFPCREVADDFMGPLFQKPMRAGIIVRMAHIHLLMKQGKVTQARTEMFQLWDFVLKAYYAGQLVGGMSMATQDAVIQFGQIIYCMVGLDGSGLTLGDPLGSGNKTQVVFPNPTVNQDVVHGSGNAGIRFFAGSLALPVTVTVSAITGTFAPYHGPLNTKLDQYGPFFEFHVIPESNLTQLALVAECLVAPVGDVPPTTHIAHNVGTGLEILPLEPSFLDCTGPIGMAPSVGELLARHDLAGAARRIGERALHLFAPEPAWAGNGSTGGKAKTFSPFGGVDTLVKVEAASPSFQLAPAGSAVAVAPKVLVHTRGALTPLDGAVVTFTIAAGGGTETAIGNPAQVTTVVATTDIAGNAAVGSWTVGVGANALNAAAAFAPPASGSGVGIDGTPVVFTATGGDLIPWEGSGYKYLSGAAGGTPGFEAPSFDDSNWGIGQAGFGSGSVESTTCPLDASVHTPWTPGSVEVPVDMLLRHSFTLPTGWSSDLSLSIAIDNDIQVFVNGTDVTATASPAVDLVGGFVQHEGCASRGSSTFTISHSLLHAGSNVLAIRARDRGIVAFVDAQLIVPTP